MIYSLAEYLGLGLLLLAFIGAGIAIQRLDRAIVGDADAPIDADQSAQSDVDRADESHAGAATASTTDAASTRPAPARQGVSRRSRRKHGR